MNRLTARQAFRRDKFNVLSYETRRGQNSFLKITLDSLLDYGVYTFLTAYRKGNSKQGSENYESSRSQF